MITSKSTSKGSISKNIRGLQNVGKRNASVKLGMESTNLVYVWFRIRIRVPSNTKLYQLYKYLKKICTVFCQKYWTCKKNPYIINQNHIFFLKKSLWSHFWIDFNKFTPKHSELSIFWLFIYSLCCYEWVLFKIHFDFPIYFN